MSEEGAALQYRAVQLQRILQEIVRRERDASSAVTEATLAIQAITAIKDGEGSASMISLGLGAMIKANLSETKAVLVQIGREAVVEMDPDSAINHLESRIAELTTQLKDLENHRLRVVEDLKGVSAQMDAASRTEVPAPGK